MCNFHYSKAIYRVNCVIVSPQIENTIRGELPQKSPQIVNTKRGEISQKPPQKSSSEALNMKRTISLTTSMVIMIMMHLFDKK